MVKHKRDIGLDLYILQMHTTGEVKVGRSSDVTSRIKQLQTGCPHPLKIILMIPGGGGREKELHGLMSRGRLQGEWFSEDVLSELPPEIYGLLDLENQDWWRVEPIR